jgi:pimeloyl-ACP methyl ester carboxylesterase
VLELISKIFELNKYKNEDQGRTMSINLRTLLLGIALILLGGFLANQIQTVSGEVDVSTVRFAGNNGIITHAKLYVPEGVTNDNPAPGIVAIHGYINTNETQSGFAIEFARRGYVVLAPDQTGHGYSDPPAFANGFGGMDALAYMRTLPFVDTDNIGLEGHSMGGWSSLIAASVYPDGYKSMVIAGSSPGTFGAPEGTATWPRNLAVVFSRFDEFSQLMWGIEVPADIVETDKLKTLFNTDETIERGKVYGDIDAGTARVLYQPPVTHPGDHLSTVAIGHAIDWFDRTLDGGEPLPVSDQIWIWKELGTLLSLIGMVVLIPNVIRGLAQTAPFRSAMASPVAPKSLTGGGWWIGAFVFMALPVVTLFPFKGLSETWGWAASALLPQNITTQVMVWAIGVGLIASLLFVAWHFLINRKTGATALHYGLVSSDGFSPGAILRSLGLALAVVGVLYTSLLITAYLFDTDYRFWVFAMKPLSALHLRIALSYVIPFCLFFTVVAVLLQGQLRQNDWSFRRELFTNWVLLTGGYVVLLVIQYIPLLMGGSLTIASEPLWTIIAFQFLPLMTIAALVFTVAYRATGTVYTGAFINGMLVTGIVVASQATHYAF